ncbi:MAG: L-lactate permease [Candidatus Bipolaricaulota bacterium]
MEFSIPLWFISFLPIAMLLFLISYIELSSKLSAAISMGLAAVLALTTFGMKWGQLIISAGKGAMLGLYVILIIVGAVVLFNIVNIAGGFDSMKGYINGLGGDRNLKLLGLSWAFSAFIQGITGFGVPVAIVGSMLVGIGYQPIIALITVLIGHSWAISFGSMGSSFYALKLVTGLETIALGTTMASLFFLPILTTGMFAVHVYGGIDAVKKQLKHILPVGLAMGSTLLLAAYLGFPHIATLLAGLVGSTIFLSILLYRTQRQTPLEEGLMPLKSALFPYIVLILSVLATQIPAVSGILPDWEIAFSFPGFTTQLGFEVGPESNYSPIGVFEHPFFFLVLSAGLGAAFYLSRGDLSGRDLRSVLGESYSSARSSIVTVGLLMILASIMNDSGMVYTFARGMARFSKDFFPIISPIIGILGAFLTGSNTSSNVLFGAFQVDSAALLGYSPYLIAAAQSVGGSLGSAIAPAKIVMGTAVVGLEGTEGNIVKRCLGYTLISGLLVGLVILLLLHVF